MHKPFLYQDDYRKGDYHKKMIHYKTGIYEESFWQI